ncbi:hypothetical protein EON65_23515 [archaeon]|nr:MAG: hypothetical protein EON65_23515 [archaeon]
MLVSALRLRAHKPVHALRYNIQVNRFTKRLKKVPTDGLAFPVMSDGTIGLVLRGRCVAASDPLVLAQTVQRAYCVSTAKG